MRYAVAFALLLVVAGCNDTKPPVTPPKPAAASDVDPISMRNYPLESYTRVHISVKGIKLNPYLADDPGKEAEGLMFVREKDLGEDDGMLFILAAEQQAGFWMKNTLIPLDIAFVKSNGAIANILTMKALDESPQRSAGPVKYALEMHEGWFAKHGVKPGDQLDLGKLPLRK